MSATEGGKSLDRGKTRVVVSRWGEMSEGRVCLKAGPAQYLSPVQGAGDPSEPREPSIGQGEYPQRLFPWSTPPSGSDSRNGARPAGL